MPNERRVVIEVVGDNAANVVSDPFYVGMNEFSVDMQGAAALHRVEISNDQENWTIATDLDGNNIATHAAGFEQARERAIWARAVVESGGVTGTVYPFIFSVFREDH